MNNLIIAGAICLGMTVVTVIIIHWINKGIRNNNQQIVLAGLVCFLLVNATIWACTPFVMEYLSQGGR